MSNYLNAYNFFINSYEIFSYVYTFYWLSDEGIKHLIDILINEN